MKTCLDNAVMTRMQEMAVESLDPDNFEKWENVRDRLYASRSSLGCQGDNKCIPCYSGKGICEAT